MIAQSPPNAPRRLQDAQYQQGLVIDAEWSVLMGLHGGH
jgi:hypothetical protein